MAHKGQILDPENLCSFAGSVINAVSSIRDDMLSDSKPRNSEGNVNIQGHRIHNRSMQVVVTTFDGAGTHSLQNGDKGILIYTKAEVANGYGNNGTTYTATHQNAVIDSISRNTMDADEGETTITFVVFDDGAGDLAAYA